MRIPVTVVAALAGVVVMTMSGMATASARTGNVPAGERAQSGVTRDDPFTAGMLAEHNRYRARHGSPALVLDQTLMGHAVAWAQKMAAADKFSHSGGPYGENLYLSWPAQPTPAAIVKAWYDEISNYDFNRPGFSATTGHFTQVVWKNSARLGVGIAKSASGRWYVAAEYNPPGNYAGQFPQNVLRPR